MDIKHRLAILLLPALGVSVAAPAAAQMAAGQRCAVHSGPRTAALVELYSSEGCSSCPPADQRLNALRKEAGAASLVVPLALHVTYWDQIGWADPLAQAQFDARQARLLRYQRRQVAYTPQFFVGGTELRGWQTQLPAAIRRINATAASVNIGLSATPGAGGKLLLDAHASAPDAATSGELYLAISESGITSTVLRGENRGATLHHDAAVRLWLGPVALAQGRAQLRREVDLPASWRPERLQVVAFVQQTGGSAILQAVSTASCAGGVL
ncbi:DUF1223 domain-containing protein [Janthinobacterium sp. 1_2014MBL_MicDiv]|uniref:DUF1223 domain-containing protein n=1 Tax=Janthinobacterium sp. 1_2014MBL_MicDiv TaxID=1644131 RepID=UPI0008F49A48|nr:DUF1223 domain-containing protein [Janthinobacterium sp. 1_2014MBL_MicDiv]APA68301.1 hypothetical protein YQ44_11215 [Janthinobacterium sp. 1_2014MBL_MicDiv]